MKASPRPSPKERGKKHHRSKSRPEAYRPPRFLYYLVFAFAFLVYSNTLNHGYVLDDDVVYVKNKDVQAGTAGIKSILSHSFIYGFTGLNDQSYRPAVLIMYAIEKQMFGNNPARGHLINVLFFALGCVLLFRLLQLLLSDSVKIAEQTGIGLIDKWIPAQTLIPLIGALLFAAHPVHTEAVANIKGRDEIMHFIFIVLSLTYFIKYFDLKNTKHLAYSTLFFFLALLSKEMAVTFLVITPLTVLFFRKIAVKSVLMPAAWLGGAFILYMLIRNSVLDAVTFNEKMKVMNNALAGATNEADRIATAILILGMYVKLLFFPHPLSWDYSYNQIPIVGFGDLYVILSIALFIGLGVFALIKLKGRITNVELQMTNYELRIPIAIGANTGEIIAWAIMLFVMSMSVVSNIFIMIGATLGERFLFTPSIGLCLALPILFHSAGKKVLVPLSLAVIILFAFKTHDRNKDWKDNESLFAAGVEDTPKSSRAQSALGSVYRERGENESDPQRRLALFNQSIPYYIKAIEILPENSEALYNSGVSYYGIGDIEKAKDAYIKTLEVSPDHSNAANNLGVIFFQQQQYDEAEKYFEHALKFNPGNADALGNLGAINQNLGRLDKAIEYYQRSLAIKPGNQVVINNMNKIEKAH